MLRQITHTVSDFAIAAFLVLGWRVPEDVSMIFLHLSTSGTNMTLLFFRV